MFEQKTLPENEATKNELRWKALVLHLQSFEGTHAEYCHAHALKLSDLRRYKKKFGVTRSYQRKKPRAFVKAECSESPIPVPEQKSAAPQPMATLPDPQWLADLILAVMGRR